MIEKKFPNRGVDAGLAGKYNVRDSGRKKKHHWDVTTIFYSDDSPMPHFDHEGWQNNPDADYLLPTTLLHEHSDHSSCYLDTQPCEPAVLGLAASVWPIVRESFFLSNAHVKPLFDVNAPLLEMTTWGLVCALAEDWLPHRTMGVDLAIATIEDGRWDSVRVGRLMAVGVYFSHRFVKTLPEVGANSPLHAFQVAQCLIQMLANCPINRPSGFAGLLELLYELMEELQLDIDNQTAVEFLESIKGSSKAAKCAKRILRFEPESETNFAAVYQQAIHGRLATERRIARSLSKYRR